VGLSFDPEGLVLHPASGRAYVSDEYGPSVVGVCTGPTSRSTTRTSSLSLLQLVCHSEKILLTRLPVQNVFTVEGKLIRTFPIPPNLVARTENGSAYFGADDQPPTTSGRQSNRGYEGAY
jgi:hypothetical protein